MSVAVKICGLKDKAALHASIESGASFLGFVFVPASKRYIAPDAARSLLATLPHPALCRFTTPTDELQEAGSLVLTALFVDPTDEDLKKVCEALSPFLGLIQLHGKETPARVRAIKKLTGLPVMKAIAVATAKDFENVAAYEAVADMLLFDTKSPDGKSGGSGQSFDWSLLDKRNFSKPWVLAGGLTAKNLRKAVAQSGARIVDVSSGVETNGQKDVQKIKSFLTVCQNV